MRLPFLNQTNREKTIPQGKKPEVTGRLDSVTNVCFRVSEFNGSIPAMKLKSGRSTPDPLRSVEILQTSQSAEARFWN